MAHDFDPLRRALNGHLTDREYGAACEAEAARYRQALENIQALFSHPWVDGRTVRDTVEAALATRPFASPARAAETVLALVAAQ